MSKLYTNIVKTLVIMTDQLSDKEKEKLCTLLDKDPEILEQEITENDIKLLYNAGFFDSDENLDDLINDVRNVDETILVLY